MKTVSKTAVDELLRLTRKYKKTGDTDILPAKAHAAKQVSISAYGNEGCWLSFSDLAYCIIGTYALKPDMSNDEFYKLLYHIGFEVKEERI